jgi:hypothetical protein
MSNKTNILKQNKLLIKNKAPNWCAATNWQSSSIICEATADIFPIATTAG